MDMQLKTRYKMTLFTLILIYTIYKALDTSFKKLVKINAS